MKKIILYTFLSMVPICGLQAQTLEWTQSFEEHSGGRGVDIMPNSIMDGNGAFITLVVEDEELKLYKTQENGTLADMFQTNRLVEQYTPLINVGENELAIVFNEQGVENGYRLLQTDFEFNVTRDFELEFPVELISPRVLSLIPYNGSLFVTLFAGAGVTVHYMFRINSNNTLTHIYDEVIGVPYGEDYITLDSNCIVFSYQQSNQHMVRCVSLLDGEVLWARSVDQNFGLPLDYHVLHKNDTLFTIALERTWVEGNAVDALSVKYLDGKSGSVIIDKSIELPDAENCQIDLHDFAYNHVHDQLYICYSSCSVESASSIVSLQVEGGEIVDQNNFPYIEDIELPVIGTLANLHVMPDGSVVLIHKSYKDSIELSNLYISPLDHDLNKLGTVEINFSPRNSSEFNTHVLSMDGNRILVTGIVPDPSPSVFWEQVTYFTAMIHLDIVLSDQNNVLKSPEIHLFPNPATQRVNVSVSERILDVMLFDSMGKLVINQVINHHAFELDLLKLSPGVYFLYMTGETNNYTRKLAIE